VSDFRLPFQKRLCEEVALGLESTERGGNSVGIILRGGSGRGKTHAIDLAIRSLPPRHRVGAQVITPCIRLDASALSGGNALQAACLAQLGMGPESPRSRNPGEMERRLYGALLTHRVQAIILEEFHNLLLLGKPELKSRSGEFLKNLWNFNPPDAIAHWATGGGAASGHRKLVIVISGTHEIERPFAQSPELTSRFAITIEAPRLQMFPNESFREFRALIREFASRFDLTERVDPDDDAFAACCYFACGAHLRELENLFQRADSLLRRKLPPMTTHELFAKAYRAVGAQPAALGNPFSWSAEDLGVAVKREMTIQSGRRGSRS
jgi:hypothetical protein